MADTVQTVNGPITPDELGRVLMHEHLCCDVTPPDIFPPGTQDGIIGLENCWQIRYEWCTFPGNSRLDENDPVLPELVELREHGFSTVVELTPVGMKRNPAQLEFLSQKSGIHIVAGCGYYVEGFLPPEILALSEEELARNMKKDLLTGMNETAIRSGIIGEIACSAEWTDFERRVLRAAAQVMAATGASLNVHPHRSPRGPKDIIRYIGSHGGDPTRTIISHIDRTIFDEYDLFELADTGCGIEYDFFGIESSYYPFQNIDLPNDGMRLKYLRTLIDRGHLEQLLISQDICTKTRLRSYGGHGYAHIPRNVLPLMRNRGFSEEEIDTILVKNPRRYLTIG